MNRTSNSIQAHDNPFNVNIKNDIAELSCRFDVHLERQISLSLSFPGHVHIRLVLSVLNNKWLLIITGSNERMNELSESSGFGFNHFYILAIIKWPLCKYCFYYCQLKSIRLIYQPLITVL